MTDPRRILLISLSNIGDAILTTPVLEALARHWPSAAITVLVGPRAVPLFERDPRVAQVWPYDKMASLAEKARLVWRIRRARFDRVVNLRHGFLPRMPGHRVTRHLEVARRMGIPIEGVGLRVYVPPEDEATVAGWLGTVRSPLIAIAPGARSHLKRWTAPGFAAVADVLMRESGAQVVLVGDAEDRPIADEVAAAIGARHPQSSISAWHLRNLAGQTTLRQLAALLARMALVLTNDSACLHLAGAVGTPVVALFGPTDPVKYGPAGPRDAVARLALVCSPCERALCPYGHECLQWLPARDVLAAVRKALNPS